MKDLNTLIDFNKYSGIMYIGDLHSVLPCLKQAIEFADENNLFLVSVGDLFDGGEYPYEVAEMVLDRLNGNGYAQVRGNHDNKLYRYAIGNPVKLGSEQFQTLKNVGDHRHDLFVDLVKRIYDHPKTAFCFKLNNLRVIHAGIHRRLWAEECEVSGGIKSMALYGQKDGSIDEQGYENRIYDWLDDMPHGSVGVVGHDREALGKGKKEPLIHRTRQGGHIFFIDTSCGKDVHGPLTGAVFLNTPSGLDFSHFASFK